MPPHDKSVDFADPDDDLFDESWQAPKRTNRLTVVLVVALLVVAGFAGGVLVQKHHDSGIVAANAGAETRRTGSGAGSGTGAGSSRGQQGDHEGGSSGTAGDAGTAPPVVTGTVRTVGTDAIEVTDDTGAIVRVFVPSTATVSTQGLRGLTFGTPVSVAGTKAVDGSVTATSVTARAG